MLTTSLVIPTYHRPDELRACIDSALRQTRRPDEIVVIDDGCLDAVPLADECRAAGVRVIYHRKSAPDVCVSRNMGAQLATADIVFQLDDDVVLLPDFVEQIARVFEDPRFVRVGGVCGLLAERPPWRLKDRVREACHILFLISGFREGRVLPSGFSTEMDRSSFPIRRLTPVNFFPGGMCAFRKEVFREFLFRPGYLQWGIGEDKDFTVRVSRHYLLMVNPEARLHHRPSPRMRCDRVTDARRHLVGIYLLFRAEAYRGWWSWIVFGYATGGFLLSRLVAAACFPSRAKIERLRGYAEALRLIRDGGPDAFLRATDGRVPAEAPP